MLLPRRSVLTAASAALLVPALPHTTMAQSASVGAEMRMAAQTFLATLDERMLAEVTFPFDGRQRFAWNFMLGARRPAAATLEDMTSVQKDAALGLLATALSAEGLQKAEHIMLQQDILRDEWGKGSPDRNRERFAAMIFGAPSADAPWGWRWEGHHLSLSFTLVGDQVVAVTPSAFSSEPNEVPSGPHAGLVVLKEEERLARALYTDLSRRNRRAALAATNAPGNILSTSGREASLEDDTRGVRLGDLPKRQQDMALRLIDVFSAAPLTAALADRQRARVAQSDLMAARFLWAGADLDRAIYYRLHGETFLIEFATLRNQPQHLHAVYHDVAHHLGQHAL